MHNQKWIKDMDRIQVNRFSFRRKGNKKEKTRQDTFDFDTLSYVRYVLTCVCAFLLVASFGCTSETRR